MQKNILWLTAILVLVSPAVRAETLDDASIKQIYAEATANIRDAAKTHTMMEQRLDESFTLTSHITQVINGGTAQTSTENKDKSQAIHDQLEGMAQLNMKSYNEDIVSIKYSADKAQAFVSDKSAAVGTMSVPGPDGQYVNMQYSAHETCADTLGLIGAQVKIMKSDCTDQVAIQK